jgi:hypothetical protein
MGMFDEIKCDAALPDNRIEPGRWFQTKSLLNCTFKYTISEKGRLIHHFQRFEPGPDRETGRGVSLPTRNLVEERDIDTEFHGDVRFYTHNGKNEWVDYVARFSNGTVEWILSFEELSKLHENWSLTREW